MSSLHNTAPVQEWRTAAAFRAGDKQRKHYLQQWQLEPDGKPFKTYACWLQPVRYQQQPAMLKIALEAEEQRGGLLMAYWNGDGAARVWRQEGPALLLERLNSTPALAQMARNGQDAAASRIICHVADQLHTPRKGPRPAQLVPLETWFAELAPAAGKYGGILEDARLIAHDLLRHQQEICVLHGDLHHGNILDGGPRGWLAIDPKGLLGDRGYDYANIFCNPNRKIAGAPGRLAQQVAVVSTAARIEPARLLRWIIAYGGLSAAWSLNAGEDATIALRAAETAYALLSS
jgi:streptomycin 6-kinase